MKKDKGQYSLINTGSMASARSMRKLKRDREVERIRLTRKNKVQFSEPVAWTEMEMLLPKESRYWLVNIGPCPECRSAGKAQMRNRVNTTNQVGFSVHCADCTFKTPNLPSSQLAIRHWKLVSALTK